MPVPDEALDGTMAPPEALAKSSGSCDFRPSLERDGWFGL